MMRHKYHSVVIGGGILGCAIAVALQRRLVRNEKVLLIDKGEIMGGVSVEHSGIVRAAHRHPESAKLGVKAIRLWRDIASQWGVNVTARKRGCLWITSEDKGNEWAQLQDQLNAAGVNYYGVEPTEALRLSRSKLKLYEDEKVFFEPSAVQLEATELREAVYAALKINNITVWQNCSVEPLQAGAGDSIQVVNTAQGNVYCDHVVNATGAWSESLLQHFNTAVPIHLDRVLVGNWQTNPEVIHPEMPVISDMVNNIYFRSWPGHQVHMHRPRRTGSMPTNGDDGSINKEPESILGNEPRRSDWTIHNEAHEYGQQLRYRFEIVGEDRITSANYRYFDVTPDHRFILGADDRVDNLFHCIGGGQAMKFAPVFGQIISRMIVEGKHCNSGFDLGDFHISRFQDNQEHMAIHS